MAQATTLFSSTVITATGSETDSRSVIDTTVSIELIATGVSGATPSVVFSIQWSDDDVNFATTAADTFPPITAVGNTIQLFPVRGQFYNLAWTVAGTAPYFTVTAIAYS